MHTFQDIKKLAEEMSVLAMYGLSPLNFRVLQHDDGSFSVDLYSCDNHLRELACGDAKDCAMAIMREVITILSEEIIFLESRISS